MKNRTILLGIFMFFVLTSNTFSQDYTGPMTTQHEGCLIQARRSYLSNVWNESFTYANVVWNQTVSWCNAMWGD